MPFSSSFLGSEKGDASILNYSFIATKEGICCPLLLRISIIDERNE